jgi:hypothetical protein
MYIVRSLLEFLGQAPTIPALQARHQKRLRNQDCVHRSQHRPSVRLTMAAQLTLSSHQHRRIVFVTYLFSAGIGISLRQTPQMKRAGVALISKISCPNRLIKLESAEYA